jgi:hypothetical protein
VVVNLYIKYSDLEMKNALTELTYSGSTAIFDMCDNCTIRWLNVWDEVGTVTPYDFALDGIGKFCLCKGHDTSV